jgi:hypothetical protein
VERSDGRYAVAEGLLNWRVCGQPGKIEETAGDLSTAFHPRRRVAREQEKSS